MGVEVLFKGPDITGKQLKAFEKQWEITLPDDYRKFLLKNNGGLPNPNCFDFKWKDVDAYGYVGRLLGLGYPAAMYSFEQNMTRYKAPIIPERFFLIAMNYTGLAFYLVCMSIQGDDFGSVYFLPAYDLLGKITEDDIEQYCDENPDRKSNYPAHYLIAESFTQFLDALIDDPGGEFTTSYHF